MANRNPFQGYINQMQRVARSGGGGFPGGGPPPRGLAAMVASGLLAVGGVYIASNSLFNVDGGHRAIKYKRLSGVGKEIYSEGKSRFCRPNQETQVAFARRLLTVENRNTFRDPMVRDTYHIRCSREATKRFFPHRHQGFADGQYHLPCALETRDCGASPDLPDPRH